MNSYTDFLGELLPEAAELATNFSGRVNPTVKDDDGDQVVTEADLAVGSMLSDAIARSFPKDGIIEEESGARRGSSGTTWVIDPIDGTANFAAGSPLYAVMAGVLSEGEVVAGGIALPAFGELYLAERGSGTTRDGVLLPPVRRTGLDSALVAYGIDVHNHRATRHDLAALGLIGSRCRGLRMSNSAYDLIMVSSGVYGGYLHRSCRIWDCVAPQIVVQEAGGAYTDFRGRPVDYSAPFNRTAEDISVIAGAPGAHRELVELSE